MKVINLTAISTGHLYPPGCTPGIHFCYRLQSRKKVNEKVPMTRLEVEPATFQLVSQCLNQLRYGSTPWPTYSKATRDAFRLSACLHHYSIAPRESRWLGLHFMCGGCEKLYKMRIILLNSAGAAVVQDGRKILTDEKRSRWPPNQPGKQSSWRHKQ